MWSDADRRFMARALQLARQGLYTTDPNPRVGCVIVRDGDIVGEGLHWRAGEGHAEVNALAQAGVSAKGATAYVTLEPCSHFGKTPPCAEGLINAGVSRVVAAMVDPNPQVAGRGIKRLQEAGIETSVGLLEAEAKALNPGFIKRMQSGLPWVRIKTAASVDGRTAMASGESKWITHTSARMDVQKLRARSSVIITGVESILHDDSSLTVREDELGLANSAEVAKRQPLRVILDSHLRTPPTAKIVSQTGRTVIATLSDKSPEADALKSAGAEIKVIPPDESLPSETGRVSIPAVLQWLAQDEQCNEVLVETGATLAGAFLETQLVDEVYYYMAMKILGSEARPAFALPFSTMAEQLKLQKVDDRWLGEDLRLVFKPQYNEDGNLNQPARIHSEGSK